LGARKKKKPGRPRVKKAADVRRHRFSVSVSDRELRRLRALARAEGKPLAVVLHELAIRELDRREPPGGK